MDLILLIQPLHIFKQIHIPSDGRVGTTTAAHNWWENNSSGYRSTDFDSPSTTGSVDFDGTDDYLSVPSSSDLQLGSSDFTIEGWIYLDSIGASSDRTIIAKWDLIPGLSEFALQVFLVMYLECIF